MHDIIYFLSKPGVLPRVPQLLLVGAPGLDAENPAVDDLTGVVLVFEHRIAGIETRIYATNDRSGRNSLVAAPQHRMQLARTVAHALLERGAHLVLMSFRMDDEIAPAATSESLLLAGAKHSRKSVRWAVRERLIPGYLPLAETYDATLASIGQKTRFNLRYYRRRAESQLGCVFVSPARPSREELVAFSQESMYPVPARTMALRYDSLWELSQPFLMGLKDKSGRWLSMLGGRRYLDRSEILWQLNRDGLAPYSLGTVMRSYCIENEILHGSRRLYIEGGTSQPIKFSFVPEKVVDLAFVRPTVVANAIQAVARKYISPDNELLHMLWAPGLEWKTAAPANRSKPSLR